MDIDSSPPQPRVLSIKEAARACGISRATLYRLINDRKLATVKIASRPYRRMRFRPASIGAGFPSKCIGRGGTGSDLDRRELAVVDKAIERSARNPARARGFFDRQHVRGRRIDVHSIALVLSRRPPGAIGDLG